MKRSGSTHRLALTSLGAAVGLVAVLGGPVLADALGNDDRGSATVVGGVPFHDSLDTSEATPQQGDPECASSDEAPNPTVWYSFTPAEVGTYLANTFGSDYDTTLVVSIPDGSGGLDVIGCNDDWNGLQSRIVWTASAGQEYLIMAGACCGSEGGQLEVDIDRAPPAPQVGLRVAGSGTLTRLGAVIIHGRVRCENADRATIHVQGRQDAGRRIIRGYGHRRVDCSQTWSPWRLNVRNSDFRFARGTMLVTANARACSLVDCDRKTRRIAVTVR